MARDMPRKYASCCTPLRGQRRYSYFRPHLMPADETAAVLLQQQPTSATAHSSASSSFEPSNAAAPLVDKHMDAAVDKHMDAANVRTFEKACETFVSGLLRIVETHNTEIALFRAVLAVLYSVCCMVGDARYLPRILHSFSIRLRTAKNHHSPAGELQRLQLRSNCIKSNDIAEEGSEGTISRAISSPSAVASSPSRTASWPSRTSSENAADWAFSKPANSNKCGAAEGFSEASAAALPSAVLDGDALVSKMSSPMLRRGSLIDTEVSFGSTLASRRSQTLVESVQLLTIDTGIKLEPNPLHPMSSSLNHQMNASAALLEPHGEENEDEDEDEEGSDWDESDDWSDEEDLGAFELEVASFLAAVKHQSRQWTGHVGTPEQRRRVRRLLSVENDPRFLRSLDDQIREMPVTVRTMVHRLQSD